MAQDGAVNNLQIFILLLFQKPLKPVSNFSENEKNVSAFDHRKNYENKMIY